jgi:hyaluronate lyase
MRRLRTAASAFVSVLALTFAGAGIGLASSLTVTAAHLTTAIQTYGAATTCTLAADADSYVNKSLGTTNFGTAITLQVDPDTVATQRAFIHFNLGSCSPSIPSTAIIQSATLRLTIAVLTTATRTVQLSPASASWTETGVTWNSQPGAGSVTASTSVPSGSTVGTVITWTAASDVQAFVSGASSNVGWRLSDSAEGVVGGPLLTFDSREASTGQPQLVVTYVS